MPVAKIMADNWSGFCNANIVAKIEPINNW